MPDAANELLESAPEKAASSASLRPIPEDLEGLKAMVGALIGEVDQVRKEAAANEQRLTREFEQRLQDLYEQLRLQRARTFGRSSEAHAGQDTLFNEVESICDEADVSPVPEQAVLPAAGPAPVAAKSAKPRGKRAPLPAELPRVDVIHDVQEAERTCACGTPMVEIGADVSEQLDIVPMQIRVLRHIRKRYGCARREHAPVVAPTPPQVLPKSNASADLLAMLLTTKYVDGLPLARFEYVLARHGVLVPRHTLARWVIAVAAALQPLANLVRDTLLDSAVIHMDETPVQVLKEPGRSATSESYMWVQCGGPPDRPVVMYDYDPSRGAKVPLRLLEGWRGYLMADGHSAYETLTSATSGIEQLACMVHARRRFVDAAKAQPHGRSGRADQAIEYFRQLYKIEREAKEMTDAERYALRQARSVPVLEELRKWLTTNLPLAPPSTKLGDALGYLHNQWPKLVRYVERGDLPIDNNRAENAIRPFVVGRKAWLFSDTPAGAHASAVIYSLIETAKANGKEPYLWLRRALRQLPLAKTADDYEALLPWNLHALDLTSDPLI